MKFIILLSLVAFACSNAQQEKSNPADEAAIRAVLDKQVAAWNEANLDEFMKGYWKSDSILFIGSTVTSGWEATLERYKKTYPDKQAMGTLRFEIMRVDFISTDAYLVTGKYFLTRVNDSPSGIFTLLFRKKDGEWVVVYDHTS